METLPPGPSEIHGGLNPAKDLAGSSGVKRVMRPLFQRRPGSKDQRLHGSPQRKPTHPLHCRQTTPPGLHHHCIPPPLLLHVGPLKTVPGRKLAGAIRVFAGPPGPVRRSDGQLDRYHCVSVERRLGRRMPLAHVITVSASSPSIGVSLFLVPVRRWRGSRHGRRLNHSNTSPFQFHRCPAGLFVSLSWVSGWWCHLMSSSFLAASSRLVCARRGERRALISTASPSLP